LLVFINKKALQINKKALQNIFLKGFLIVENKL